MLNPEFVEVVVFILCSLIKFSYNIDYYDIQAMALSCPEQDKCSGYKFDKNFTERSCECDSGCKEYNDCCIDYRPTSRASQSDWVTEVWPIHEGRPRPLETEAHRMVCLDIGVDNFTGVYAIASCEEGWTGPPEIRRKCEGPDDFINPPRSAPVVSVSQYVAYRNMYCHRCNPDRSSRHDVRGTAMFLIKLSCEGLQGMSDREILSDLLYSRPHKSWGLNRLNKENALEFHACSILYEPRPDMYGYLRFCRGNLVTSCNPLWKGQSVKKRCDEYMAVVYDDSYAYKNPHCAFCNYKTAEEITCKRDFFPKQRSLSHTIMVDFPRLMYWFDPSSMG